MKISYSNDSGKGPGYGMLRCTDASVPETEGSFALQRGTDRAFLNSRQEWIPQQTFLRAESIAREGDALLLSLGPGVVNALNPQETYRVLLQGKGGQVYGVLRVNNVIRGTTPAGEHMPAPPEETELPPTPAPDAAQQTHDAAAASVPEQPDPPVTPDEPIFLEMTPEQQAAQNTAAPNAGSPSRSRLIPILLLMLVLGAGAGIWWYILHPARQTEPSAPPAQPVAEESARSPKAPEPAPEPSAPPSAEKQVAMFFGDPARTPAAAAELSRTLPRVTKSDQDRIYRLYYFAGEQGERSILMDYAACLDPSRPAWGSIDKDPVSAWNIYEKAQAAGIPEAETARQQMKAWLQTQAASGNAQASYWLRHLP